MDNPKVYWDTFSGKYQHGEQKHRIYMLDLLKKKGVKSILDVGCGTGCLWEIINDHREKYDFTYLGTDYSQGMIEACKVNFPDIAWVQEDARHLKEDNNSWDCVVLLHSLDHLDDYKSAISEAARVAQRYVCIVLWRPLMDSETNNLNDKNMYGKKEGDNPWLDTHLQEYSRNLLEEEFKKNNLVIEETAEGEAINSDQSKFNFLYLLRKEAK